MRSDRVKTWVDRVGISVGALGLLTMIAGLLMVASDVKSKMDDAQGKLAAEQMTTSMLEEMLERRDVAIGEYDERLAVACDGLWACNWQETMNGVIFDAREVDEWTESMRKQDAGLAACKKSYPKGAEYRTNP